MLKSNYGLPNDANENDSGADGSIRGDNEKVSTADDDTCFFSWEYERKRIGETPTSKEQPNKGADEKCADIFASTVTKLLIRPFDDLDQSKPFVGLNRGELNDSDESTFV